LTQGKFCLYQRHDNGIHEFIFTEATTEAVDEWIGWLDYIATHYPVEDGAKQLGLIDSRRSGPLPLYYVFRSAGEWIQQRDPAYHHAPIHMALVYSHPTFYINIADYLLRTFGTPNTAMRFFRNDRDGAIQWLLSD
jgi:hypothetical protein